MTRRQEIEIQQILEDIRVNRIRQWTLPATVVLTSMGVGAAVATLIFTLAAA